MIDDVAHQLPVTWLSCWSQADICNATQMQMVIQLYLNLHDLTLLHSPRMVHLDMINSFARSWIFTPHST